jgi:hypothetical protein
LDSILRAILACDIGLQGSVFRSAHAEQKQANQVHTLLQPCALQADAMIDGDLDSYAISEIWWLAGCACRDKSPGVNIDVVLGV